jgi:hypothetical protein
LNKMKTIDYTSMDNITCYFWDLFVKEFKYLKRYNFTRRALIAKRRVLDYMFIRHASKKEEIIFALEESLIPSDLTIQRLRYDTETNNIYHPNGFCVCVL